MPRMKGEARKGPQADLSLALDRSQPVIAAISYLDGVIVVKSARTSVRLPLRHVVEVFGNVGPAGQRVAAMVLFAAIAFDVRREFPLIGILHYCRGDRVVSSPCVTSRIMGRPLCRIASDHALTSAALSSFMPSILM